MFHNGFKDRNIPNGIGNLKKTEVHTLHSYGVFRSRYGQACYKHFTPTGFRHIIREFPLFAGNSPGSICTPHSLF